MTVPATNVELAKSKRSVPPAAPITPVQLRTVSTELPRLLPLDISEHPDPGFRLHWLTSEGRRAGILPCYEGSFGPVHLDHVAGERLFGRLVRHYVLDDRVQRRVRSHRARSDLA